jgi:antitoxin (DNA-binding transcriptional repressor) of toxin-antitoxin stability system
VVEISVWDLRKRWSNVVNRATRGEQITITHARGLSRTPLSAEMLIRHRRLLPRVDPVALRKDIDEVLDAGPE